MKDDSVSKCPPGLEAVWEAIEQAQHTKDHGNQVKGIIPVVSDNPCVIEISLETLNCGQIPVDQMRHL